MSAGWEEGDEVPNGRRFRQLFRLGWTQTFRVSAGNREESLGQQSSSVPELLDTTIG